MNYFITLSLIIKNTIPKSFVICILLLYIYNKSIIKILNKYILNIILIIIFYKIFLFFIFKKN